MRDITSEEGTLSAKFFSRQGDVQEFLSDNIGSTQGLGLFYEVDFNSFKELWRKVFNKKEAPKKESKKQKTEPMSVMGNDSLIRFYAKNKY